MKLEGQVRIPSGCAIAAAISRDGKRMTGEMIINAMKPMHTVPMVWAAVSQATEFTRNIRNFMPCICFLTAVAHERIAKCF